MTVPIMTAARPMTIAPLPELTSAKPWYCEYNALARPTRPLEIIRPSTVLKFVLMPCARLMFGLQPVARIEQPRSVPKNQYNMAIIAIINKATTKIEFR